MRARHVTAGEHEAVVALGDRVQQLAQHVTQAGKALERAQLEHFVQQERGGRIVARSRATDQAKGAIERGTRGDGRVLWRGGRLAVQRERRGRGECLVEAFGCAGRAFDVDVLALVAAQAVVERVQERRAARAAPADHHRNAWRRRVERGEDAAFKAGVGSHHRLVSCMGMRTP